MNAAERFTSWAPRFLGVLRFFAGTMFACHGAQKIFGAFGGIPAGMAPSWLIWTAGPIEFFGGVLIAIGLFTRPVAFLASGLMAVAYWYGHGLSGKGFWPKENGGELAVLYCFVFLYLAAAGAGAFSLDSLRRRRA